MSGIFQTPEFSSLSEEDKSVQINFINLGRYLENYFALAEATKDKKVLRVLMWFGIHFELTTNSCQE